MRSGEREKIKEREKKGNMERRREKERIQEETIKKRKGRE